MRIPTTQSDPSGLFGAIGTTVGALLMLGVVLGILDGDTAEAILAVVATLGPLAVAAGIRRHAYAPTSVRIREQMIRAEQAGHDLDGAAAATRDRDTSTITDGARERIAHETDPGANR